MAKTRVQKENILSGYQKYLNDYNSFIVVHIDKLKTHPLEELKKDIFLVSSKFVFIKNTLFNIALKNLNRDGLDLSGELGVIFVKEDVSSTFNKLSSFIYKNESSLSIKRVFHENFLYDEVSTSKIAMLPSRNDIYSNLLGNLTSPIVKLVTDLQFVKIKFIMTLKLVEQHK